VNCLGTLSTGEVSGHLQGFLNPLTLCMIIVSFTQVSSTAILPTGGLEGSRSEWPREPWHA
jgi:hypothetical protein